MSPHVPLCRRTRGYGMSCARNGRERPSIDPGRSGESAAARSASGRWVIPLPSHNFPVFSQNARWPGGEPYGQRHYDDPRGGGVPEAEREDSIPPCGRRQDPRLQGWRGLAVPAQRHREVDRAAVRRTRETRRKVVPGRMPMSGVSVALSGQSRKSCVAISSSPNMARSFCRSSCCAVSIASWRRPNGTSSKRPRGCPTPWMTRPGR